MRTAASTPTTGALPPPTPLTLRELWDAHAAHVLRNLRYLGVREADLDDALQETFTIANKKLGSLGASGSPRAWLHAIALNVARHARRARTTVAMDDVPESSDGQDLAHQTQARDELLWLLAKLDEEKREVVVLYFLEQCTLREIAEVQGCPLQTVYSRLGAATRALEIARDHARKAG